MPNTRTTTPPASRLCGVDEAGRGPLAGAVFAAAVILDPGRRIRGLADSKALKPQRREELALRIRDRAIAWAVASADVDEIDAINILQASLAAMGRAIAQLCVAPDEVVVDGLHVPRMTIHCMLRAVVGGDASIPAISAASILAKTARDAEMRLLDERYPGYGFAQHKGYCTAEHLERLRVLGPCAIHRRSFAPVREAYSQRDLPF
jgi:ribonuclease HII